VLVLQTSHYDEFELHLDIDFTRQSLLELQATHPSPELEHFVLPPI